MFESGDPVLLYILLVVAVALGFALGQRRAARRAADSGAGTVSNDTLAGLAHLLDDQPDRAAVALAERLDVNADTLETHLALAALVRRRGEVDQAIRIHQRLLARPVLSRRRMAQVELELARDYLSAGLYDRAESLLTTLVQSSDLRDQARQLLLDVYERERDWPAATQVARALAGRNRPDVRKALAHYLCEQAEQLRAGRDLLGARRLLREALAQDDNCVRASILLGRTELAAGNRRDALKALRRVPVQAPEFIPEVLDDLAACFPKAHEGPATGRTNAPWAGRGDQHREWRRLLERLAQDSPAVSVVARLAACVEQDEGPGAAHLVLARHLAERPSVRGLDHLLALRLRQQGDQPPPGDRAAASADGTPGDLDILKRFIEVLAARAPQYRCGNCGLAGHLLHWQCPSCRQWGSTMPVHGVDGE